MPIRDIVKSDHAFTPGDTKVLGAAFDETLSALQVDREDPLTLLIAKFIVELAKEGERDPMRLRELALKSVTGRSA